MKNNEIRNMDMQTIIIVSDMNNMLEEMILEASPYMSGVEKLNALTDCMMLKEINDKSTELTNGFKLSKGLTFFDATEITKLMDESVFIYTDTVMTMAKHIVPFYQNPENFMRFDGDVINSVASKIEAIIDMMDNIIELREKINLLKGN